MARFALPFGALLALLALAPATASAATASMETRANDAGAPIATLVFRAAPGERNALEAALEPDAVRVTDAVAIVPGAGCLSTSDPNTVRCTLPAGVVLRGADVDLGDGVDTALLDRGLDQGTVVRGRSGADDIHASGVLFGEGGDDILSGGAHSDILDGGTGDDLLFGGPGEDLLHPGRGHDIIQSGDGDDTIAARDGEFDRISCGGGRDTGSIDRLDYPGETCFGSKLKRLGKPRATPLDATLTLTGKLLLEVACPSDFPRACRGKVTAKLGRKVLGRHRFRVARGTHAASAVRPSRKQVRRIRRATREGLYKGKLVVTARVGKRKVTARVALNVDQRG
jgi:hypothetical protein